MSDKVIRIASQQGFSDSWTTADPSNLNLLDFTIPSGMIVDLSKSYIAFNTEVTHAAGGNFATGLEPTNTMIKMNGLNAADDAIEVPNVALIRNAHINCDAKGMIESIRRVDTLKSSLWNLEHDAEDRKDDMNAFTAPKGVRGIGNQSSYFLDPCTQSKDANDVDIVGAESRNIARDVKVPIKDIFGIGEADDWNTSKFGETRIHCETNWKDVRAEKLGGNEETCLSFDGTNQWGKMSDQTLVAAAATAEVITEITYDDWQLKVPFFLGQRCLISATTNNADPNPADVPVEISAISYNSGNRKVYITFSAAWFTEGQGAGVTLSDILLKADNTYVPGVTVNKAELVLFTKSPMPTADSYNYVTYTTEQDNGNAIDSFSRGYVVEPSAQNLFVALCRSGKKLPTTQIVSYRYAVDNEDQTGNRSIAPASPLQYDRLIRCLDAASPTTEWRNAQQRFLNLKPDTAAAGGTVAPVNPPGLTDSMYDQFNTLICETLMQTPEPKYLDLQIESTGTADANDDKKLEDIILYKQHFKSI